MRGFFGKKGWRESVNGDIQDYLERETKDNLDRGMNPEQARRAAIRKLGNITRIQEETRAVWTVLWIDSLIQDVRYALGMLKRNSVFSMTVVLTLSLGIGMNTAMFSVVKAVFLQRLPYPNAERLVWIANYDTDYEPEVDLRVLPSDFLAFQQGASAFERIAAYSNDDLALVYGRTTAAERIASITGDFWTMTGAQAALGRLTASAEQNVIVLSWQLYQRRFGNDSSVIGKLVTVEGHQFQIAGVLPPSFHLHFPQFLYPEDEQRDIDAYINIPSAALSLPLTAYKGNNWDDVVRRLGPTPLFVWVVGRLKPAAPLQMGRAELEAIYSRLIKNGPTVYHTHRGLRVQQLQRKLVSSARPAFLILSGAVGFLLLIVCANVANLLLARTSSRQREIGIRTALGAGRSRLLRQFLTESIVYALAGGIAGTAFAGGLLTVISRMAPDAIPRLKEAQIDGSALLFCLIVSLLTAIAFGFAPGASLLTDDITSSVREQGATSSASAGRLRLRCALAVVEVALAIALLSGAGLLLKSFWRMSALPTGFSPDKIIAMNVSLIGQRYETWPEQHSYIDELFHRLDILPGVLAEGIHCATFNTEVEVQETRSNSSSFAGIEYVSPGYLRAMGVRLVKGSWPSEKEALDRVIVNQSFARKASLNEDIIGKRIHASLLSAVVSGIVPDFKVSQLDAEPGPIVYAAYQMSPHISFLTAAIRVSSDPARLMPVIRKRVSDIDQNVPAYRIQTLEQALANSIAPRRFNMFLLAAVALAAMILASVGVYGVLAYLVSQRTREIGIRMALGAKRGEVLGLVIGKGMAIVFTGIAAGIISALALGRLLVSLLYDVNPNDPSTLLTVAAILAVIAFLACCGPAWKASHIDPIRALRND